MPTSFSPRISRPATVNSFDRNGAEIHTSRSDDLRQVVLAANADGIDLLRRGRPVMAFEQLKYAEAVLVSNPEVSADESELFALTCSNLGCYYKKAGLPRAAVLYLGRALKAEKAAEVVVPQDVCTLATTKLNACAALSGVGRHEEAEKLAVAAMQLLAPMDGAVPSREECSLLAVACHNLGAEREHLGRWAPAAVVYRQGSEVARKVLGPKNPLTRTLQERCVQALSKAERNPLAEWRPKRPKGSLPKRPPTRGQQLAFNASQGRILQQESHNVAWEPSKLAAGSGGVKEGHGEDHVRGNEMSQSESDLAARMDQDMMSSNGRQELDEDAAEEDDQEYDLTMRAVVSGRFLPSVSSRQRGISILDPPCRPGSAPRRWSTATSQQSSPIKSPQQSIQSPSQNLPRFTQIGALPLGALQEGQVVDHECPPSPSRAKAFPDSEYSPGALSNTSGHMISPTISRGRSGSTMNASPYSSEKY